MPNPAPASPGRARSVGGLIATLVIACIGFLGAFGALYLGWKWREDFNSFAADLLALLPASKATDLQAAKTAATVLLLTGFIGGVASLLLFWGRYIKVLALVLIFCGVMPLVFHQSAMFGVPMTVAGVLALFLREKKSFQGVNAV